MLHFRSKHFKELITMSALKQAIIHSLLRKESLCCLCFNSVASELVFIDEAIVDDSNNIKLSEVLNIVLGSDVIENLAFETICNNCVVSAVQSYKFIKRCRENYEDLREAIQNIDSCLQAAGNINSCKSVFLSLGASLAAEIYYDYKQPVASLANALVRFKCVSSDVCNGKYYIESSPRNQPKTWIAPKLNNDSDDDFDDNFSTAKEESTLKVSKPRRKMDFLSDKVIFDKNSTYKKHICNGCKKSFENVTILRNHYMRVHAPKNLQCPKCDSKFSASKLLENHLSLSHANAVCFQCGKIFTNIASLKKHELSHKSTRYVCQNCHRVYKTLQTIKDHVRNGVCERGGRISRKLISTGQFICEVCGCHFASKNAIHSHMITLHNYGSDETVHTCQWCNKRFRAASSLKGHIVKHTGERRFQCDLCDEKFVTQAALVNHTRLHTGEKPYACDFCDESFISTSRRMDHLRRKHLEPSLPCRLCPMIFKSGAGKRKHERRHFNPNSKLYVSEDLRPAGIKEPKAVAAPSTRKKRRVVRMDIEN